MALKQVSPVLLSVDVADKAIDTSLAKARTAVLFVAAAGS